jgi:hypothetical protein
MRIMGENRQLVTAASRHSTALVRLTNECGSPPDLPTHVGSHFVVIVANLFKFEQGTLKPGEEGVKRIDAIDVGSASQRGCPTPRPSVVA